MKILVLGLGNPILSDDGVGFHVVDFLKREVKNKNIKFQKTSLAGLNILELIFDFDKVVIIDAIMLGEEIGKVYKLEIEDFEKTLHTASHDVGFRDVIEIGKKYYRKRMPKKIVVFGVEVKNVHTFSEKLSPEVERLIPEICSHIKKELE